MRSGSFLKTLGFAWQGIWYALVSQRNMKIHVLAAFLVFVSGWFLQLDRIEWVLIIFAISLVWVAEIINTSLEEIVDLVSPGYNAKAGQAKNLGAAAVLMTAINAVLIGIFILGPHLLQLMVR